MSAVKFFAFTVLVRNVIDGLRCGSGIADSPAAARAPQRYPPAESLKILDPVAVAEHAVEVRQFAVHRRQQIQLVVGVNSARVKKGADGRTVLELDRRVQRQTRQGYGARFNDDLHPSRLPLPVLP